MKRKYVLRAVWLVLVVATAIVQVMMKKENEAEKQEETHAHKAARNDASNPWANAGRKD